MIHHGRQYQVMTNSPVYDQQLALNEYWKQIGGTVMLPGTNRAADRFARASFYVNAAQQSADPREAVAAVFSVMRNVSVPRGISTSGQPNISSTIWRTVADQKNKVYYFENTASPSLVWVKLGRIDFRSARAFGSSRFTATRIWGATRPRASGRPPRSYSWRRTEPIEESQLTMSPNNSLQRTPLKGRR